MITWITDNFFWFQVVSAVISIALVAHIVYLIVRMDYFSDRRDYGWRVLRGAAGERRRTLKTWKHVLDKVQTSDPVLWRQAIDEAGAILSETLRAAGYQGASLDEQLERATEAQVAGSQITERIRVRLRPVLEDTSTPLELTHVKELLRAYRDILKGFGLIE
jgi:hypothetical protein